MNNSSTIRSAPEEFHWGISYLREDIQDLRDQIRPMHQRMDRINESLADRFDEFNQRLNKFNESLILRHNETNQRIDEIYESLTLRIDETNKRIGEIYESLTLRIDETNKRIDETNQRIEGEVGVIAPGKQADLAVIGRDLFREPPHHIHAIPVDLTMLAGRVVFTRDGAGF